MCSKKFHCVQMVNGWRADVELRVIVHMMRESAFYSDMSEYSDIK